MTACIYKSDKAHERRDWGDRVLISTSKMAMTDQLDRNGGIRFYLVSSYAEDSIALINIWYP
jgi:hypothetical protein